MQISQSDTDPNRLVVTVEADSVVVTSPDGEVTTHRLTKGKTLTLSEEITYEDFFKLAWSVFAETSYDTLAHALKEEKQNGKTTRTANAEFPHRGQ